MIKYIDADILQALGFLPYGLAVGLPVAALAVRMINRRREKQQKPAASWVRVTAFCVYLAVLFTITFLSREHGSRSEVLDMKLFSTWGINDRNNALVVENVLLFLPFGILYCWNASREKKLLRCTLFGAVTSLGIETLQLITGRGYFQIDDILTNTLGALIGALLFVCVGGLLKRFFQHKKEKEDGEEGHELRQ